MTLLPCCGGGLTQQALSACCAGWVAARPGHISQEGANVQIPGSITEPYFISTQKHWNVFKGFLNLGNSPYALTNVLWPLLLVALQVDKPKGLTTRSEHPLGPYTSIQINKVNSNNCITSN